MEYFEIFNINGKLLGRELRSEVHEKGFWHRCVNILIQRSNGDVIIQLRSKNKDVCPDAWDFSVCEHLQTGETYLEAAVRGLKEELSIEKCPLRPAGSEYLFTLEIPELQIRDNEFQQTFFAEYDGPVHLDHNEVAAIRWISIEKLQKELPEQPSRFTPWFKQFLNRDLPF